MRPALGASHNLRVNRDRSAQLPSPGVQGHLWVEGPSAEEPTAASEDSAGSEEGSSALGEADSGGAEDAAPALVVRVLPDVVGLDKTFDYAVPDSWQADGRAERLAVGSIVRIPLGSRRERGWVTGMDIEPPPGVELKPLSKLTGMGPPADVVSLAEWAAWRWAGRTVHLLRAASPPRVVTRPAGASTVAAGGAGVSGSWALGRGRVPDGPPVAAGGAGVSGSWGEVGGGGSSGFGGQAGARTVEAGGRQGRSRRMAVAGDGSLKGCDGLFDRPGCVTVLRCPPGDSGAPVARAAARRGDSLIVVPTPADARRIAADLRSRGVRVALGFDDWAVAAAGATVVGTRTAVWLPMPRLAAVVLLDEHSESLRSEQAPTWHAREVALERARRVGAPAVLVSPIPTLEALEAGELWTVDRSAERDGWPVVDVLDRRLDDPVRGGLFAERLRDLLVAARGRVAVVLNRKGRARLLACKACGELARTSDGRTPMRLTDEELVAADGSERRPVVCAGCGSTVLRNLRIGVTRAREELAALAGEPVGELTADSDRFGDERIVIGTEAVLWRLPSATAVVFLDFDPELLAPRQRASEQALALLARGARLTGGRRVGGRLVVQTRQPDHPVVQAAVRADPSIVSTVERDRRRDLGLPPYGAQARLSGPGAETFIATMRASADTAVSIRGPVGGHYLLRAPSHDPLLDLLVRTPRPAERLRVEVDPLRV